MSARANLLPLTHSLTLLAMIGANVAAAIRAPSMCWIAIPVAALAMCCALSVVHEAAHRTYFTGRRANDIAGRVWALLILMNAAQYKRDHLEHHRHQGTERDTEPQIVLASRLDLLRAILINPHIAASWVASFRSAIGADPAPPAARRDALWLLGVQLALLAGFVWSPLALILAFVAPFALSTVLDNLVSLPEHARLAHAADVPVTRSIRASTALGFLLYFVHRHIEHHDIPGVSARALSPREGAEVAVGQSYWQCYFRLLRDLPWRTAAQPSAWTAPRITAS